MKKSNIVWVEGHFERIDEKKDEKKDEMKNRISMALKDPILQQGFEIICKENTELKEQLTKAKELLKDLLVELDGLSELSGLSYKSKLKEQVEQFLKEE